MSKAVVNSTCSGSNATEQGRDDDNDSEPIDGPPLPGNAGMEADNKPFDSQWHGPEAKVYRNYHIKLTGMALQLILLTCAHSKKLSTALPCDANGEFLPPVLHLYHTLKGRRTTGVLSRTTFSSSWLTSSTQKFRCRLPM